MPGPNKQDYSRWENTVLMHNNQPHKLVNVLSIAHADATPKIEVNLSDVGPLVDDTPANLFLVQPKDQEIDHLDLVLYKYQGRFFVLAGQAKVDQAKTNKQAKITGRLLSSPALKKTRIVKAAEVSAPPPLNPALPFQPERRPFSGNTRQSYGKY